MQNVLGEVETNQKHIGLLSITKSQAALDVSYKCVHDAITGESVAEELSQALEMEIYIGSRRCSFPAGNGGKHLDGLFSPLSLVGLLHCVFFTEPKYR